LKVCCENDFELNRCVEKYENGCEKMNYFEIKREKWRFSWFRMTKVDLKCMINGWEMIDNGFSL
jgi:hypothetical protein